MQINTGNHERQVNVKKSVTIDPNPRKEKEMIDRDGNVIDPRTKQIIRKNNE